jgi:hypothetical protein
MCAPPIGLIPEWAWREQRVSDINAAIERYKAAAMEVPGQWIAEKLLHEKWLRDRNSKKCVNGVCRAV